MSIVIGEIRLFAGDYTVEGWLKCDGQTVNIVDYPSLFKVIGTTYGGNGTTNFDLPDLRGRAPIHVGTGAGLPTYAAGDSGGAHEVTLAEGNLPSHAHTAAVPCSTTGGDRTNPLVAYPAVAADQIYRLSSNQNMGSWNTGSVGSGNAVDVRNPYLSTTFMIATEGIFPKVA